ncbi:MAG: UDP-N-acetylglucosamine 1-carboxyvinyltransferase [bacterium]|nr:UDP-N-acetylglucosamine 1-carboxyvinyltransferase [bacterium]
MEKFIVKGGNQLKGEIRPSGNKNEALPVLAAVLLTEEPVTIHNLPHIGDIGKMKEILEGLGVTITYKGENTYQFDAGKLVSHEPEAGLARAIRGSFLLAAPLAIRGGKTKVYEPGGDAIGKRRLDTHIHGLEQLGLKFTSKPGGYQVTTKGLSGAHLLLDEASVMATEHLVMAAALAKGTTSIYNAACEPHVQGLCQMLNLMGAKISGIGSNLLVVQGVERLGGCDYTIQPDHTEVGSLIGLAAVTKSEILIKDAGWAHLGQILSYFKRLGVEVVHQGKDDLLIPAKQKMVIQNDLDQSIPKIDDAPWPGFPADLTSIMTIVATQCKGTVLIFEKLFESRLFWVDKLIGMGAKIVLCDPHRAVVVGPSLLRATTLTSPDIRAGMALLIAALCAKGTSEIHNIQQIDRGYAAIDQRLNALGAEILRV